ncbi:MAG: rhomboid family intramembrane serine protease [Flavobacteriaceae bacterium]|nr:rhomboid family intramembrane serine protease [Flavobacteriaceae bacterium]
MDWKSQLRYKYAMASMTEKLIGANLVFFVLIFVFKTIGFLFNSDGNFLVEWLVFDKEPYEFIFKPWSIVSYAFMHAGFFHLLFNMIVLYFSGRFFLEFFSPKKMLNYYFLGAISGAVVFMLSYNLFPAFQGVGKSYLIGASASVMAILVGIATKAPNLSMRFFLIGNVKLWHIAVVFVVLDVTRIPLGNAGGHLAHLGGAMLGYFYTKQLDKGIDIGSGFEKFMDGLIDYFSSFGQKKSKMKTVYNNKSSKKKTQKSNLKKDEKQKRIDEILDKISKNGYDSLSKEEKDFLFNAGKDM